MSKSIVELMTAHPAFRRKSLRETNINTGREVITPLNSWDANLRTSDEDKFYDWSNPLIDSLKADAKAHGIALAIDDSFEYGFISVDEP